MQLLKFIFLFFVTATFVHSSNLQRVPNGGVCLSKYSIDLLPRNFRSLYKVNGFPKNFRVSGSAQMTEKQIEDLGYVLRKITDDPTMPVYILDLRHELHGFYHGLPIYVWEENFWEDLHRFISPTYEHNYFANLNRLDGVPYYANITKIKGMRYFETVDVMHPKQYQVSSEGDICEKVDMKYVHIPILDRDRPDTFTVNILLDFFKSLPKNAWLHVHCHGGKGRTSTVLLMYHLFKKKEQNLEAIVKLHAENGSVDLLNKKGDVKVDANESRKKFVRDFFAFSKKRPLGMWKENCVDSLCKIRIESTFYS